MHKICLVVGLMVLAGCAPQAPVEQVYPLPEEMKHCKVYKLDDGDRPIRVVYCPKADTATSYVQSCGKSCKRVVTTAVVAQDG